LTLLFVITLIVIVFIFYDDAENNCIQDDVVHDDAINNNDMYKDIYEKILQTISQNKKEDIFIEKNVSTRKTTLSSPIPIPVPVPVLHGKI